jgi:hypothetical protein
MERRTAFPLWLPRLSMIPGVGSTENARTTKRAEGRGNFDRFTPGQRGRTARKRGAADVAETNAAYRAMIGNQHSRVELRLISMPWAQRIVSAPPVLIASTNTVDYICGDCSVILMYADRGGDQNSNPCRSNS